MEERHRLKVLDGLRAIAILLVIGYHYFVRWTPPVGQSNLYPYGGAGAHFWLFKYGDLGVQIFFVISGFVISMTLFKCRTIGHFFWKRFARLFPTMLICSVISFIILNLLPQKAFVPQVRDFLPSLTFTDPIIWQKIFGVPFAAMDGAYWSLFVEVKFYIWIGILYFLTGPTWFFRVVAIGFGALISAYLFARAMGFHHLWAIDFIFVVGELPWFIAGVGFYALYVNIRNQMGWLLLIEAAVAMTFLRMGNHVGTAAPYLAMAFCFLIFMALFKRPRWVGWLGYPPLAAIGMASYSLYLLHQYIGVAILDVVREFLNVDDQVYSVFLVPCIVVGLMMASLAIYRYWEVPAKEFILGWRLTRPSAMSGVASVKRSDQGPQ